MNENKFKNIQISKIVTDFLNFQIYGTHANNCLTRFTQVSLSISSKEILKDIENAIFNGDETKLIHNRNIVETQRVLSDLMMNVSLAEQNLIHCISLIVDHDNDQAKFDLYERTYNRILTKQTRRANESTEGKY